MSKTMERQLNPEIIHDIAAHLFWNLAAESNCAHAEGLVRETNGIALLEHPNSVLILESFDFHELQKSQQEEVLDAVLDEVFEALQQQRSLDGIIYIDDASTCRSPSAEKIDTSSLMVMPTSVKSSHPIERVGKLCLRSPLPAVVFSDRRPKSALIEVADTKSALGFQFPIFLLITGETENPDRTYACTGVFQIPVPDDVHGDRWTSVIPNATKFISGENFATETEMLKIEVEWVREKGSFFKRLFRKQ